MTQRRELLKGITAYPLVWPHGVDQHAKKERKQARFIIRPQRALLELHEELKRWCVEEYVLSMNVFPEEIESLANDPAVALWFSPSSQNQSYVVFPCDAFLYPWQNIRAVGLTLHRLRRIEEFGSFGRKQAIQGAVALPCYAVQPKQRGWIEKVRALGKFL